MVTLQAKKRLTSKEVWISDVVNGEFIKGSGWDPSYIEIKGEKVSRVNIVATVVSKFMSEDGNYGALTLDDTSETIRVKAFGPDVVKLEAAKIGNLIRFIGKIKEYNEEMYFSPEILRPLKDPNWVIVHKLTLGAPSGSIRQEELKLEIPEDKAEEQIKQEDQNVSRTILDLIRSLTGADGAPMDEVLTKSGLDEDEAKNIIVGLLKSGDVYEPKKGKLKILD